MNKEEIKEILEELENMYEISELEEQVNNINKIRDYITNLQQENQKYKEVGNTYKKRCQLAIEYIESKEYEYGDEEQDNYIYDIGFDEVNELLDILRGMK